jgi:hypothetical protein
VEFTVVDETAGLVDYEESKHHPASHVRETGTWTLTGDHFIHGERLGVNVYCREVRRLLALER